MRRQEDLVEPLEVVELGILADDKAGSDLLDMLARELGYDDLVIVHRQFCELPKHFAKSEMSRWWYALRTRANYALVPVVAMDGCVLGCNLKASYGYADAAREVHRRLKNGGWLMADGKKFKAEDVPKFMMKCVLNGVVG